jgi:hypothetical protein
MAKNIEPDQVRAILASGHFEDLIGAIEDQRLECKVAPYLLQHEHQKQELAKDVCALANAEGGINLIGVKTERNAVHFGDEITEIHPLPQPLADLDQWQAILRTWIYPPLQHVDIHWLPSAEDRTRGILAIDIPTQPTAQRPFLLTRTIDNKGKRIEVVFGYIERRRAHAVPLSIETLQILLRDGLRYDLVNQRLEHIQELLQALQAGREQEAERATRRNMTELLRERIGQALNEVGLQDQPVFILGAIPTYPVEIPTLFTTKGAEVVHLLEHPPALRPSGFDLGTLSPARMIGGQLRRSDLPGYKLLELWFDGTLIFIARGDGDFLSWGRQTRSGEPLRLNQLSLIESTYLFAELSKQVFERAQPRPQGIEYQLELRNMTVNGTPCGLIPGPLGTFAAEFGTDIRRAPHSHATFTVGWDETGIDPRAMAFLLVSKVYEWFGIEHEHIPYTEQVGDRVIVSPDQIRRVWA